MRDDMAEMALDAQGDAWDAHYMTRRRRRRKKKAVVMCPYCGKKAEKVDSKVVYGKSYGMIYLCKCVPGWAYVGCHQTTGEPLGRLADRELRDWKKMAHAAFDKTWREAGMSRGEGYRWLSKQLGIELSKCHIGMFDVENCERVIDACRARKYGGTP